ncbi:Fic family protein [Nocardioides speluncae]|uniref:Fic family protein n=1 Tax=Nocardioides speluncae TaxID=2670337 RepID=UPI00197EDE77|nr:Fic family protein [Nocardioides speluncae]
MINEPTTPSAASDSQESDELAVTYEEHRWAAAEAESDFAMSRRARLKARGPYLAAVLPEIAHRAFRLPAEVEAEAADALMEIARFDAELSATDLGRDGEFAPLAAILLRTESASSSQIEKVTAGAKALAMATIHENAGPNAQLVAANVAAMQRAVDMADDLSEDTILAAHGALMEGQEYAQPGRFRDRQVWIGGSAPTPHTASFVPPHADRIKPAMADLLAFLDRTDIPVLPHVAIGHAQFETIHPFADGNGRSGRALVHVMLKRAGATRRLTVPVSAGLLVDTEAYFDALTAYRRGEVAPIVERFTAAAFAAVSNGRMLNRDIADLYAEWEHLIVARRDAAVWKVLPHLVCQPAITVKFVQDATGVSNPAAQNAIDQLVAAQIVTPATASRRNRVWLADGVISALDEFASRAGRRG